MTNPSPSIGPPRLRMMDDMRMHRHASTTQANYLRVVRQSTVFLEPMPDTGTAGICDAINCIWSTTAFGQLPLTR